MSAKEEWEMDPAQSIVNTFKDMMAGPKDVEKEAMAELEDMLSCYLTAKANLEEIEKYVGTLRERILKRVPAGVHQFGRKIVTVKDETRQGTVDYKRLLKDKEITEDIIAAYRKPDTSYQKLDIKVLG